MAVPPPAPALPPRGVPYGSQPDLLPPLAERTAGPAQHDNAGLRSGANHNELFRRGGVPR